MKRLFAILLAVTLVGASPLAMNVAWANQDDDDNQSLQDRLVDWDNLPQGKKIVVRHAGDNLSEDDFVEIVFGEDNVKKLDEFEETTSGLSDDDDAFWQIVAKYYDEIGMIVFGDEDFLLDIYLANISDGEKIPYNGDGIIIRYNFGFDYAEMEGIDKFYEYSSRKWRPAVVHIKDDGSREYLPATVTDGVWEFTTTSFSTFFPALVADSVEAPSTLDNTYVSIGVAMISMISLFTMGAWIAKKERR